MKKHTISMSVCAYAWLFTLATSTIAHAQPFYLQSKMGGFLSVGKGGVDDGADIELKGTPDYTLSRWVLDGHSKKGGSFYIRHITGNTLDVIDANPERGTLVQLWSYSATPGQRFRFEGAGDADYHYVVSELGTRLEVREGLFREGAVIHMWSANGFYNQKWRVRRLQEITPKISGPFCRMVGDDNLDGSTLLSVSLDIRISENRFHLMADIRYSADQGTRRIDGEWSEPIYTAPEGRRILLIPSDRTWHSEASAMAPAAGFEIGCNTGEVVTAIPAPGGPVRAFRMIGDTGGTDRGGRYIETCDCVAQLAAIEFHPIPVLFDRPL